MIRFRWSITAHLLALSLASLLGYALLRMPLQVTDSLSHILRAQNSRTLTEHVTGAFYSPSYFRPGREAQIKIILDRSRGHEADAFRAYHVAWVAALLLLAVRLMRVRDALDLAAAAFALVVLVGIHTFLGLVWESFAINHFLEVATLCLVALNLADSRGGWWADLGAALAFIAAAFTLDSGVLVWAAVAGAWIAGYRGVSWRGVALVTALLAVYFYVRFGVAHVGAPPLDERAGGFGFGRLDRDELLRRFGRHPAPFYAYNVVSSIASVLFAEPREGIWIATSHLAGDSTLPTWMVIGVLTSTLTSALIAWAAVAHARGWWAARGGTAADRLLLVFLVLLPANAVLSYGYTKNQIISTAGVAYALAAFAAVRALLHRLALAPSRARFVLPLAVLALAVSAGWAVRACATLHDMRIMAFEQRNEWAHVYEWLDAQGIVLRTIDERLLVARLQQRGLRAAAPNPFFYPRGLGRALDPGRTE